MCPRVGEVSDKVVPGGKLLTLCNVLFMGTMRDYQAS
jgi:hypothetical protein